MRQATLINCSRFVHLAGAVVVGMMSACGSSSELVARAPTTISTFSPQSGAVDTEVSIAGANFDASSANDTVKFNGVVAKVTAASTTTLAVLVPPGATTGVISVTVAGSTAVTASPFTVTEDPASGEAPVITQQPGNLVVAPGERAELIVVAIGTAPLSYQWAFGSQAIAGATASSYAISSAQSSNAGAYTVTVSNAHGFITSASATLTVTTGDTAPVITSQPTNLSVVTGSDATFSVEARGTAPLSYQWAFDGKDIAGATSASYAIAGATIGNAGNYTATVSNSVGSVHSNAAVLTVSTSTGSLTAFNLTGFGAATTGGGVIAETDAAYRRCSTPIEFATAIRDSNKTQGAVKVIEIMNDLDLGWNEIDSTVKALPSTPFRSHAAPKLHPKLLTTGVSVIDIKAKGGGLTIFSANGATIRHASLYVKGTSNIIIRNLKFDELWEWDEDSKGNYDKNDWDFIDLGNGGTVNNIWIDHCTFTKSYDGIVDIKGGSYGITFSWNTYKGDDGATNSSSFVRQQINALEAKKSSYAMYDFFRSNGFSVDDIVAIHQGHDKTHLIGANSLDSTNATHTVTFHHQWYKNTWDRLPRLRAGQVHNYNILADNTDALAALRKRDTLVAAMNSANQKMANGTYNLRPPLNGSISTEGGAVLVEKSAYTDCLWPLRNNQTDPTDSTYTGKILAKDTIYTMHNTDGTVTNVRGNSTDSSNPLGPMQATVMPFSWNTFSTLPYTYTLDDPSQLPALLQASAGAGVLTWAKDHWLKTSY